MRAPPTAALSSKRQALVISAASTVRNEAAVLHWGRRGAGHPRILHVGGACQLQNRSHRQFQSLSISMACSPVFFCRVPKPHIGPAGTQPLLHALAKATRS